MYSSIHPSQTDRSCPQEAEFLQRKNSNGTLIIRLRRIALFAQHLQVVIRGMPALAPGNDVVTFHILKGVLGVDAVRDTQGALMTLRLVGTEFLRLGERTKGQMWFSTRSDTLILVSVTFILLFPFLGVNFFCPFEP